MTDDSQYDDTGSEDAARGGRQLTAHAEAPTQDVSAIPFEEDSWDEPDDEESELPGRPRRIYATRWSAGLAALVIGAACFYAGVRVEKSKVGTGGGSGLAALASRFGAGGATGGTGRTARTGASGRAGAAAGAAGGGFPGGGGFGGAGAGAGGGTVGTVASIKGDTIYVTDTSGNTVAVKLSKSTTIKKSESVSSGHIYPGDSLVIAGTTSSGGTVSATTVTDSGASTTSSSSTSGSTSSSGSSGSSSSSGSASLQSLF